MTANGTQRNTEGVCRQKNWTSVYYPTSWQPRSGQARCISLCVRKGFISAHMRCPGCDCSYRVFYRYPEAGPTFSNRDKGNETVFRMPRMRSYPPSGSQFRTTFSEQILNSNSRNNAGMLGDLSAKALRSNLRPTLTRKVFDLGFFLGENCATCREAVPEFLRAHGGYL